MAYDYSGGQARKRYMSGRGGKAKGLSKNLKTSKAQRRPYSSTQGYGRGLVSKVNVPLQKNTARWKAWESALKSGKKMGAPLGYRFKPSKSSSKGRDTADRTRREQRTMIHSTLRKRRAKKPYVPPRNPSGGAGTRGGGGGGGGGGGSTATTPSAPAGPGAIATQGGVPYTPDRFAYAAAQNAIRSAFAERGLMNSSMFGTAMGQAADVDARRTWQEQEQARQYNMNLAARWYEMMRAGMLQEAQIRGGFDKLSVGYPNQPTYLGNLQNDPYYGIGYRPNFQNAGDPTNEWSTFKPPGGPTIQKMQMDAQTAANNARIALQKRALELEEEKWSEQKKQIAGESDIWNEMMTVAIGNTQIRENPETGEIERYGVLEPSQVLAGFKARGYDIEKMVQGNPNDPTVSRARAVYSILYPKSAQKKFKIYDTTQDWIRAKKEWKAFGTVPEVVDEAGPRSAFGRAVSTGADFGPLGAGVAARFRSLFNKEGKDYQTLMGEYFARELKRVNAERKIKGLAPTNKIPGLSGGSYERWLKGRVNER